MYHRTLSLLTAFSLAMTLSCREREKDTLEKETGPKKGDELAEIPEGPGGEVKVGAYLSLTGNQASFGNSTRNGIELAIEEINAAGGIKSKGGTKLKLIVEDNRSQVDETNNVVRKLISNDRVVALLGEIASTLSLTAAPIAQEMGIPMITPSSTNPEVTRKGPYIFRVCYTDISQGNALATFALKTLQAKKVAIFTDVKSDYSKGLAESFKKSFTEGGGEIVSEQSYAANDPDFKGQLTSIKEAAPDVLLVPGYYGDVAVIAKQAKEIGITATLLGGDGWDAPELVQIAGEAIEGAYFSNHYTAEDPDPRVQQLVSAFNAKYGRNPDGLAALGYDAAKILADAMERAESLKPSDIRKALAETKDFAGATGTITIDEERNAQKSVVMLEVKGGKFVFKERINP